ncbi:MAG TPA: SEC-C metal-binding domain-containing protein, partial [Kofleriaceae bacterium]
LEEDVPIESGMVTRSIEGAQKKVEGRNFDTRKNVLEYDDVMNQQRKTIYSLRRQILEGRYHPELTDDEIKDGKEQEPPRTESGPLKLEALTVELRPKLAEMIEVIIKRVGERDEAIARGERIDDTRPGWRVLRAEVWRQFGVLLDLERRYDLPREELLDWLTREIAASLIQQRERMYDLSDARMAAVIERVLSPEVPDDEWDWDELEDSLKEQFATEFDISPGTPDEVAAQVWPAIEQRLAEREKDLSRAWLMYFLRDFSLNEIDEQWIEHLKTMDALREGIGLQGYGQKDPKKEYKRIGFDMFREMMDRIHANTVTKLFRVQIQREEEQVPQLHHKERQMEEHGVANKSDEEAVEQDTSERQTAAQRKRVARGGGRAQGAQAARGGDGDGARAEPVRRDRPKVGRNDPCPCGSGKKYKKCHGKDEEAAASE